MAWHGCQQQEGGEEHKKKPVAAQHLQPFSLCPWSVVPLRAQLFVGAEENGVCKHVRSTLHYSSSCAPAPREFQRLDWHRGSGKNGKVLQGAAQVRAAPAPAPWVHSTVANWYDAAAAVVPRQPQTERTRQFGSRLQISSHPPFDHTAHCPNHHCPHHTPHSLRSLPAFPLQNPSFQTRAHHSLFLFCLIAHNPIRNHGF